MSAATAFANAGVEHIGVGSAGAHVDVGLTSGQTVTGTEKTDTFFGTTGNGAFIAGADDTVCGGAGTYTVVCAAGTDAADILTTAANITGVELIRIGDTPGSQTWVVLDRMSVQAAIAAAGAGDTIIVGAGTYDQTLSIDKELTIIGPNAGLAGTDDARAGEAVISGQVTISGSGAVVLDGLKFPNDTPVPEIAPGIPLVGGRPGIMTLTITSAADHVITNSVFASSVFGGATATSTEIRDIAIFTNVLIFGSLTISDNLFAGEGTGFGGFSTAVWGRGIFSNVSGAVIEITDHTFQNSHTGINFEGYANAVSSV